MWSLTIEGKITIFKTLALSKVVYLAVLTVVSNHMINELIKIQTNFIWKNTPAKIKYKILILDHKQSCLKCVDVTFKIISLSCSWLKRLFDDSFHEWKVILLFYMKKAFDNNFKFHYNLDYNLRNKFYYQNFIKKCSPIEWFTLIHLQNSPLVFWTNFYSTINMCELIKNCTF